MDAALLDRLFTRALKVCRFFPKIAEILEPLENAEQNAAPEAAEEAWQQLLEIRRVEWNPDIQNGALQKALARLPERVQQAARAAGIFRDFETVEALHTWAKKRFVESFLAYADSEQGKFLLPDGEIKTLLADAANVKALPPSSVPFEQLHAENLARQKKELERRGYSVTEGRHPQIIKTGALHDPRCLCMLCRERRDRQP